MRWSWPRFFGVFDDQSPAYLELPAQPKAFAGCGAAQTTSAIPVILGYRS